jgi:hypothetical protein
MGPQTDIDYDGTEGELYNVEEDPLQWHNRWDDPAVRSVRDDLIADLRASLPAGRPDRLAVTRPA